MDWGAELWDQFENVDKHLQHNIDFGEKYAKFVKERCSIEMEYATKMRKLVKSFQPKKREEDRSMFSTHKAFQNQLSELNDIAGQHETVAEEMMSNISKNAQVFYNELKTDKKKLYQDGRHLQSVLDQHERTLEQIKKKFEKEWKECERAQSYFEKLDSDTNVTKADVEKAKHMWTSRKDSVEGCKTDYGAFLQQFNSEQSEHYQTAMPKIFASYRDNDEKGILKFKELMIEYAKIEQKVKPIIQKCLDGMDRAANAIDAKLDAALVVEKLKSGFTPPGAKEFEDFTSPQHGKTNHEDGSDGNQRNSLVIGKPQNRKGGLSWLFGPKKPGPVNYIRKQLSAESPIPRSSSVNSDSRKSDTEENSSQGAPSIAESQQKSRTLSYTQKKSYVNVEVDEPSLTREKRSSSVDLLSRSSKPDEAKENGRQRAGSDIRSSVSRNKKKLKTMFRMSKPPEFFPKIEVSGPISVDMSGSAISTEGFIEAGGEKKRDVSFENPYDEVAICDGEPVAESPDYSHLPPEQRRKKLQKQIEDIKKELTKEDDGRKAILKMQDVYRSNPALGDANSLENQINIATQKINKLQADLNQHEAWYNEAAATVKGSPSRMTKPSPEPQPQQKPVHQPLKTDTDSKSSGLQRDQSFGDDFDEETEPIGTAVALYDFEAGQSDGALSMKAGQEFMVLEADSGDGWTRAMCGDTDGYVPTTYIEVKFYT